MSCTWVLARTRREWKCSISVQHNRQTLTWQRTSSAFVWTTMAKTKANSFPWVFWMGTSWSREASKISLRLSISLNSVIPVCPSKHLKSQFHQRWLFLKSGKTALTQLGMGIKTMVALWTCAWRASPRSNWSIGMTWWSAPSANSRRWCKKGTNNGTYRGERQRGCRVYSCSGTSVFTTTEYFVRILSAPNWCESWNSYIMAAGTKPPAADEFVVRPQWPRPPHATRCRIPYRFSWKARTCPLAHAVHDQGPSRANKRHCRRYRSGVRLYMVKACAAQ